jgi:HlyD family secretion protein
MNKKILWGVGIAAVLAVAAFFIWRGLSADTTAANAANTRTATVFTGDLAASATASGQLLPQREATLTAATLAKVTEVFVRKGDTVSAGDLLVQLDNESLLLDVNAAAETLALAEARLADLLAPPHETAVATAEANVAAARAQLTDLLAGPTENEISLAQIGVSSATASLNAAAADLGSAADAIKESQIAAAQAALISAQLQLEAAVEANEENTNEATHEARLQAERAVADAQAQLDDLLTGPNLGAAQGGVSAANARLQGREAELEQTLAGPTAAQIASAEASLAQAEAALADLLAGPTNEEIRSLEAEIEQAELNLTNAEEALADAAIAAPFDGVITEVYVNKGEFATGAVVDIADINQLDLVLEVDEVDIGRFTVGQPATFSFEAYPDRLYESEIVAIAPGGSNGTMLW